MDEIIKTIAQHMNISEKTARTALGAVMAFLKEHLPEGLSGQLMKSLPHAGGLADDFEKNKAPEASTGLLGAVTGMASKLLGGHAADASKLAGMLGQSGLSLEQVSAFLPKAVELLKAHVPPELYEKIVGMIPGLEAAAKKA